MYLEDKLMDKIFFDAQTLEASELSFASRFVPIV